MGLSGTGRSREPGSGERLGGGSKQSGRSCTSSSPGLSPSESRCQFPHKSVRSQQGHPPRARLLPGSRRAPQSALGDEA
ncbi:hypothetical protein DV515_00012347 [Chloebia gouldiae]|uniref:Uncharacterized protein n=1 Tax=Chloebia gouldiae TaxID=44316 RepID=A0A3L8S3M5_CHLGU|nr:hypothetical protein DV515_00012347 [Chloebia gouldiae]